MKIRIETTNQIRNRLDMMEGEVDEDNEIIDIIKYIGGNEFILTIIK